MADPKRTTIIQHLRRAVLRQDAGDVADALLLECWLADGDDAAFEALVRRHGPMVLGVCRRVLRDAHEAEDAYQAAFLVFFRKAASIIPRDKVGNWLHGVAYKAALRSRSAVAKRRKLEKEVAEMKATDDAPDEVWQQLLPFLDKELQALPENYRLPIVLCDLEGKTRKQASRQLGWAEGTVASRLARGRALLAQRMRRHGLPLTATALAAALTKQTACAAVPTALLISTLKAAPLFGLGHAAAGSSIPKHIASLAEGVLRAMLLHKLSRLVAVVLMIGAVTFGGGSALYKTLAAAPQDVTRKVANAASNTDVRQEQPVPAKKTDAERIVGTWRIVQWRGNGEDSAVLPFLGRITFTKDGKSTSFIIGVEGTKQESTYKLLEPGQIDAFGTSVASRLGIYKFETDDQLVICLVDRGTKRPEEYSGEKPMQALVVLARAKPGEEKLTEEDKAKYKSGLDFWREEIARSKRSNSNNVHNIGVAALHYYEAFDSYPLHAIYSKDDKTALLSWRVRLLPYLHQEELYKEFKLDEAWDSPHNKKLIVKMPNVYAAGEKSKTDEGLTHYQIFTGPGTLFDGTKKMQWTDIKNVNGISNTVMAIEAKDPVIWTKPDDLPLPKEKDKMPAVGGLYKDGLNILFVDGSVQFVRPDIDAATLRALVTPNGGEKVDLKKWIVKN